MENKSNFFALQKNKILSIARKPQKVINEEIRINVEDTIINAAVKKNASDIHFEPYDEKVVVRIRINGDLINFYQLKIDEYQLLLSRIKVLSNMDMTEKRKPQDGSFTKIIFGNSINFRVSTILLNTGEKLAIRIIYLNRYFSSYKKLNFSDFQKMKIEKILNISKGLVLIAGPTGAGKTQTLYSIINSIKNNPINITTLEDPVEIKLKGINQVNISKSSGVKFNTALKTLVRQDSDVIVIGEIRDKETARIAAEASMTSHKIYSTIHASNAYEVILRLKEMKIDKYIIDSCVVGIICQRLVKILCNNCKKIYHPNKDEIDTFCNGKESNVHFYKKCGCKECNYTGYIRRELISSVYFFEKNSKYNREKLTDNYEMKKQLYDLLLKGYIDFHDYGLILLKEQI